MQTVLVGGVILVVSVIVALGGLHGVRRRVPHHVLSPHNDVAGFVYATIAVTYAVVLGFVVVTVWEQLRDAQDQADAEANAVADVARLATWFPPAEGEAIRRAALAYADSVVEDEWPAMGRQEAPLPETEARLDDLWEAYRLAGDQTGAAAEAAYDQGLDKLDEVSNARRLRLLASRSGIPGVMWTVLLLGGVLTVAFAYVFGVEDARWHALIVAALAAALALLLFLVFVLNRPYQGVVRVESDGYELVERLWEEPLIPLQPAPVATP